MELNIFNCLGKRPCMSVYYIRVNQRLNSFKTGSLLALLPLLQLISSPHSSARLSCSGTGMWQHTPDNNWCNVSCMQRKVSVCPPTLCNCSINFNLLDASTPEMLWHRKSLHPLNLITSSKALCWHPSNVSPLHISWECSFDKMRYCTI